MGGGGKGVLARLVCGSHDEGMDDEEHRNRIEFDQRSADEASQYSLDGIPLPSLGATAASSCRRAKLRAFIVSPFNPRYRMWETFLVFLVFYTAWACPFEFGFLNTPKDPLSITDNVVNAFFALDIVLTFFVAYLDKASYLLVDQPKLIALRYAKTWLAFDVISTIPSEFAHRVLPGPLKTYGYFNMLRLWRLRRVSAMFARLEKDRSFNYFWVRCSKLICVTLFSVHFAACLFYFLALNHEHQSTWLSLATDKSQENLWSLYVTSMYWSITTLTNVGYGDLHPVNTKEMRDTVQAASDFAHRNQLPIRLQEQMLAHLFMKYRTDLEGLQQQEIIESLPKAIRSSISQYLFYSLVNKVYLFHGVSSDLLFQLVTEMKAEYFPPKEDVILQNEAPTDLYIFVTGAASFHHSKEKLNFSDGQEVITLMNGMEQVVGEVASGDLVGEIGVLCYRPQVVTIRTKRLSQILRLNRTTFLNLVHSTLGDGTIIVINFLQHLRESRYPGMDVILAETEAMIARGRMDLPITTLFAADRNSDLLLRRLLEKGSDPNEENNDGQTALHIAASKGHIHCVTLLLEYGADPNRRDNDGNVPLWEAIKGRHEPVIKLLIDNGADISYADAGNLACTAVEQNNIELLKELIQCGVDVTQPQKNGTTALHMAALEGNAELIRFLVDQGADMDKQDADGCTPRDFAEKHEKEEIKTIFQNVRASRISESDGIRSFESDPGVPAISQESVSLPSTRESAWLDNNRRYSRRYHNSIFGMISKANRDKKNRQPYESKNISRGNVNALRVRISCPEKGEHAGKLVLLPKSLEELLDIGAKKFDISATKILTLDGAEVDDINLIRDGDHVIVAGTEEKNNN
ncbi:hypothetical protein Fmac_000750 [Flemingia macrophylla]|uniref:Potassium channel n=1 Tax=Flemingia macrophylla TaxID=520843 RepID=A0ABD1NF51_9FABA